MKLIYLHGVGDGDTSRSWLDALNASLVAQGMPVVTPDDVIAPQYSDLLSAANAEASVPNLLALPRHHRTDQQRHRRPSQRRHTE